jgi:hypothetical protein
MQKSGLLYLFHFLKYLSLIISTLTMHHPLIEIRLFDTITSIANANYSI